MDFVDVLMTSESDKHIRILSGYVNRFLISIINAFKSQDFGLDTLESGAKLIVDASKKIHELDKILYVDSGGYSIIVGDVHPRAIGRFIECYTHFLNKYEEIYDYMFSLDIPIFLNYPAYNNLQFIEKMNRLALEKTVDVFKENESALKKYLYVWHFKLYEQFEIWWKLYKELLRNLPLTNHALGGMVGLKGITNIKFSPTVGMTFGIIREMLNTDDMMLPNTTRVIHWLGVSHIETRILGFMYEKLFNEHVFDNANTNVKFSYDTFSFNAEALRKLSNIKYVTESGNIIENTKDNIDMLIETIESEFDDDEFIRDIEDNLIKYHNREKMDNLYIMPLLTIKSQMNRDKLFKQMVEDINLVDIFLSAKNQYELKAKLYTPLNNWRIKTKLVTPRNISDLINSIILSWHFWQWFNSPEDRSKESKYLEMMKKQADLIRFPYRIPAA